MENPRVNLLEIFFEALRWDSVGQVAKVNMAKARETLSATIAGSGEVKYYGTPRVSQTVAGSGRIRPAADAS